MHAFIPLFGTNGSSISVILMLKEIDWVICQFLALVDLNGIYFYNVLQYFTSSFLLYTRDHKYYVLNYQTVFCIGIEAVKI
jgi:hypothetical protein